MKIKTEQFTEVARREMADLTSRAFLQLLPPVIAAMRKAGMATFPDPDEANEYSRAIRAEAVERLPELLEEFEANATARGAKVIWARNAKEANDFILNIAQTRGITYVTKGKSMVSEELGTNDVLIKNGIEAFETDLGEFIAQQLHRPPFHIVGPAVNISVQEVCDLFMEKAGMEEPTTDPVELGYAARLYLRDKFHHLEMGITGVNMAVAETGSIINVENEGNIRLTKSSPRIQVSVMSIEKVVPTMHDAMHVLRLLCRNCTGQSISSYVSIDTGPKKDDEIDGPEELYIVIVDNGRSDIYGDVKAREALRCIRCGACLNHCPVYGTIGGYPYGWAYSGPMGQVLNPLLLGLQRTQDLYRACTLCGACKEVCPAGIDHPSMFLYYRSKDVQGDGELKGKKRDWKEVFIFKLFTLASTLPWLWNMGVRLIRPFYNRNAENDVVSHISGPFEGWFRARNLPALPSKTFHERWKNIKENRSSESTGGE
jgi:L-lactate dehydrogenase complex protein LldF